jgi:Fe-S cluster biogenesis protein NfuA
MSTPDIQTAPDSDRIRRFVVEGGPALGPDGPNRFASSHDAEGVPVAEAVMSIPGVQEIVIEGNAVAVLRRSDASWDLLEERIRYALATALQGATGLRGPAAEPVPLDDDKIFELIEQAFERDVNPSVASHGGKVELIDVQNGTAVIRMMGGCHGCSMANVTLRQGIEAQLRRTIPGLKGMEDVTDHVSGANPYFK